MNLPNRLTVARVALIPVMVILMYVGGTVCNLLAAAGFGLAAFTDFLDGHIARSRGIVTDLGKFLDPVADKLLTLSAFIMLIQQGLMPAWATVIILARELCVDGLRMVAVTKGQVIAAGKLGKIKTVCQIVLILWLMLLRQPATQSLLSGALCLVVVVMTLWSGADYFVKNSGVLMEKDAK